MSKIVDDFRQEHALLLDLAEQLEACQDNARLEVFFRHLLAHLDREDQQFYPKMEQAADNNPRVRRVLNVFARDRNDVTAAAHRFFEELELQEEEWPASPPDHSDQPADPSQRIHGAGDSEVIARAVLKFFESNPEVWASPPQPTDFKGLITLVRGRISKEETILFKLHDALFSE